jgi:hypothetical protein
MSAVTKDELHRLIDELDERNLTAARRALEVVRAVGQVESPPAIVLDELSPSVTQELFRLAALDDAALWKAARSRLPRRADARLGFLNDKAQREGLTEAEQAESQALLERCGDVMLRRAQAAFLLKQRGHDVRELLPNS